MKRLLAYVFAAQMLAAPAVMAADHGSPDDARALLDKAIAKINQEGPEKAFAAFNDKKGGFIDRDLYVFVFDQKGKYKASGANPKLVGNDAKDLKDAAGKPVVKEMIARSNSYGKGEIDYVWLNRVDNRVENKHSLFEKVQDYVVGVGYYKQ